MVDTLCGYTAKAGLNAREYAIRGRCLRVRAQLRVRALPWGKNFAGVSKGEPSPLQVSLGVGVCIPYSTGASGKAKPRYALSPTAQGESEKTPPDGVKNLLIWLR